MMRDIFEFGSLRWEISNSLARMSCHAQMRSSQQHGKALALRAQDAWLVGLTDFWTIATLARDPGDERHERLQIDDYQGRKLLSLSLTTASRISAFPALMVHQWALRDASAPLTQTHVTQDQLSDLRTLINGPASDALWFSWFSANAHGERVDAGLVGPFLENCADQLCPLHIRVGNVGAQFCHTNLFHECRIGQGVLRLRSESSEFEVALNPLSMACVSSDSKAQSLLLYDEPGNCVASVGLAMGADARALQLWQSMFKALRA